MTRAYKQLALAVTVLLGLRCRPGPAEHVLPASATTPAPATALARHVAEAAPAGAINCGAGHDARSDATVDACGTDALAHRRPFYAVFLPWPGRASDIVTSPHQLTMAYVADDTPAISTVVQIGPNEFHSTPILGRAVGSADAPMRPLRGMRLPQFASTGPLPRQPRRTAIVEVTVTADGRVSDTRIVKPISKEVNDQVIVLVTGSLTAPARLFGVGIPVIVTVAVDDENGRLVIRRN